MPPIIDSSNYYIPFHVFYDDYIGNVAVIQIYYGDESIGNYP